MKRKHDESGAIIVEASIVLPLFIFIFLTFYSVITICITEAKVQNALTNAAKQISSYSYIYAFTGAYDKAVQLNQDAQATKDDIKTNVVDNIITFSSGIEGLMTTGKTAVDDIKTTELSQIMSKTENFKGYVSDIKGHSEEIKSSGKALFDYFKKFKDPSQIKEFAMSIVKVLGSDAFDILKNMLGGILAKQLCCATCTNDADREFFEGINYDKSQLFPGTSGDIILVAEYHVRVAPFIPVDLKYTISQKAVTRGWLNGDGGKIERNGVKIVAQPVKQRNKVWDLGLYDRSKTIINAKKDALASNGFHEVNGKNNIVYNEKTNTYAVVASSDPAYGKKPGEELNQEEIEQMLLQNVATANEINSHIRYKDKTGNTTVVKDYYPYEKSKEVPLKKQIYLTVSEDEGVKDKVWEIWQSIPDDKKDGVELVLEAKYGSHYKQY